MIYILIYIPLIIFAFVAFLVAIEMAYIFFMASLGTLIDYFGGIIIWLTKLISGA